ncbi:MAG: DUF262 domain-containing protein [Lachnospiraceae bacterium]|nr:DUF262 domain-containing protein [Lachnospiraceae bacterium]
MNQEYQIFELEAKLKEEISGLEYEDEADDLGMDEIEGIPYCADDIRIDQKMFSLYQVFRWIQQGKLNLRPDFQRNFIWSRKKQSLLIESLMLKIPIPAFYFDEDAEGNRTVIDGLQRLSTISDFLEGKFRLYGLQYLINCNGKSFEELDKRYQMRIEDTQLAINILDAKCPAMVKFDVFRRINTGGVPLNSQEVRNVMANRRTQEFLLRLSQSEAFVSATRGKIKDNRMGAQELCLRFVTYLVLYDRENKNFISFGEMNHLLDTAVIEINRMDDSDLKIFEEQFATSMKRCIFLLGKQAFSKPSSNQIINRALFISWSVILANRDYSLEWCRKKSEKACILQQKYLQADTDYFNAITSSTSSRRNMLIQFHYVERILEELDD